MEALKNDGLHEEKVQKKQVFDINLKGFEFFFERGHFFYSPKVFRNFNVRCSFFCFFTSVRWFKPFTWVN